MAPKYMLIVLSVVCFVHCENANINRTKQLAQDSESSIRKSREVGSYVGLISCAVKYDVSCFVDAAEDILEVRRTELLGKCYKILVKLSCLFISFLYIGIYIWRNN